MPVKAGNIVHVGQGTAVIDRIQTGGPGQVNVRSELDYELGNYNSVGQTFDIPDLSFSLESRDVSTEIEQLLLDRTIPASSTVTNVARSAGGVVTLTTGATHSLAVGDIIRVAGVTNDTNSFNGVFTVATVPTGTTLTYAQSGTTVASTAATGTTPILTCQIDLRKAKPFFVKSAFKNGSDATSPFDVIRSVGVPGLTLESISYRFGLRDAATQAVTLRGDSIYYNQGSTYMESAVGTNAANQTIVTAQPAYAVTEGGVQRRILCIYAGSTRLEFNTDWTEAYGTVTAGAAVTTITIIAAVPTTSTIRIMYSSPTVENLPQTVHATAPTKPSQVRGRDIDLFLGAYTPGASTNRVGTVQSVNIDWRVTLQQDEEFGNYHYFNQDYDVPQVSGSFALKPKTATEFVDRVKQIAGLSSGTESIPATAQGLLNLTVVVRSPGTATVLKVLNVPDARFTVPGFSGRVQQKLETTFNFQSDGGLLYVGAA
jgi:hypothetical protein